MLASNLAAVRYYTESSTVRKGEVGSKSAMARVSFDDLLRLAEQNDPRAQKALTQMAAHLGAASPCSFPASRPKCWWSFGEVTRAWDRIGSLVESAVKARCFTHASTRILPANSDLQPRLKAHRPRASKAFWRAVHRLFSLGYFFEKNTGHKVGVGGRLFATATNYQTPVNMCRHAFVGSVEFPFTHELCFYPKLPMS